eukprot:1161917-Pelagomonas_calceolata.AAC.11
MEGGLTEGLCRMDDLIPCVLGCSHSDTPVTSTQSALAMCKPFLNMRSWTWLVAFSFFPQTCAAQKK